MACEQGPVRTFSTGTANADPIIGLLIPFAPSAMRKHLRCSPTITQTVIRATHSLSSSSRRLGRPSASTARSLKTLVGRASCKHRETVGGCALSSPLLSSHSGLGMGSCRIVSHHTPFIGPPGGRQGSTVGTSLTEEVL